jgi:CRP-like cAMP-binding protein
MTTNPDGTGRPRVQFPPVADPKLEHLANVKMFSSLNKKELRLVSRVADVFTVGDGTEIVREGTIGHEFYLIVEGKAAVLRGGQKIAELGPAQYFGELALLDRGPRSATVVADGTVELAVIGQREFFALLDEVPPLAHKLLVGMASRLREADTKALSH